MPSVSSDEKHNINGGDKEDAVCRICFGEPDEGSESLQMECSCKVELALVHQECAVTWFSIKGSKTCELCKQKVRNLLVIVQRIQPQQTETLRDSQGVVPVVWIVRNAAYFCFLVQILVRR